MGKPTIADLAKAAGVSVTTVSHAFSGRRYVEPETRKRIEALAHAIGYRPNHRAQRLRTGRAGSIALVSSMPFAVAAGPSRLGFLMEIAAAAAVAAFSRGIALCLVPPLGPSDSLDALEVDGAIVVEPELNDPVLDFFFDRGVDVVSIGRAPGRDDLPFVDLQSGATAHLMLDHLLAGGGRVGLITGVQRRNSYIEMETIYAERMAKAGLSPLAVRVDERGANRPRPWPPKLSCGRTPPFLPYACRSTPLRPAFWTRHAPSDARSPRTSALRPVMTACVPSWPRRPSRRLIFISIRWRRRQSICSWPVWATTTTNQALCRHQRWCRELRRGRHRCRFVHCNPGGHRTFP